MKSEFSRMIDVRQASGKLAEFSAGEAERKALARRFGLVAVERLEANVVLERDDRVVKATGTLSADIVQSCAVSGEDLPVAIREELSFRFVPQKGGQLPDEEVELDAEELDQIEYSGTSFDLGEAVAQSLALAIDPFATGPDAEEVRRKAGLVGEEATGPFAALAKLKKDEE